MGYNATVPKKKKKVLASGYTQTNVCIRWLCFGSNVEKFFFFVNFFVTSCRVVNVNVLIRLFDVAGCVSEHVLQHYYTNNNNFRD